MPLYYESLCYKSLHDPDSIEMLGIINATRKADLGKTFGWASALQSALGIAVINGAVNAASLVETHAAAIETAIDNSYTAMILD